MRTRYVNHCSSEFPDTKLVMRASSTSFNDAKFLDQISFLKDVIKKNLTQNKIADRVTKLGCE
jgi:hypothetical protein